MTVKVGDSAVLHAKRQQVADLGDAFGKKGSWIWGMESNQLLE